jgi:hypothetical protein
MPREALIVVVSLLTIMGGLVFLSLWYERKRSKALRTLAEGLGGRFEARPGMAAIPGAERFELFTQGFDRMVHNLLTGQKKGRQISVFDYGYATGNGKTHTSRWQTVVHLHLPGMRLPAFSMRPEPVPHRIGEPFGDAETGLEADPVLSRQYLLHGPDEHGIRALFGPEMRDFYQRNEELCTEAVDEDLFFWRAGKLVAPENVVEMLDLAEDLASRLAASSGAQASASR